MKIIWLPLLAGLLAAGCRGFPATGEKSARTEAAAAGRALAGPPAALPADPTLREAVRFALRNQPSVRAAYADWAGSVEQITVARSLPDPKLTFELYAADAVSSLMPGLMADIPGPGKRAARAAMAMAGSQAGYFRFQSAGLQTAFTVEQSFYPLHFLDARLRVNRQTLSLLADLETLARAQNEVGRATLQDVLRAQIEQEKLRKETADLEDSRHVLLARFKAALGISPGQPDPPVPTAAEFAEGGATEEEQFAAALKQNPRLQELAAEIRVAEAAIRVAQKDRVPDFSAGFAVDAKAAPAVWNPQFSLTLPVWRDKLAAELAAARDARGAAEARLTAEQITLAAEFAGQTYLIRAADRELTLLRDRLLPRAKLSLKVSRAAYRSGQTDFLNVMESERALLDFQLDEIAAETQRELARAELRLLVAGVIPADSPWPKTETSPTTP